MNQTEDAIMSMDGLYMTDNCFQRFFFIRIKHAYSNFPTERSLFLTADQFAKKKNLQQHHIVRKQ